jgi:signal transduction histidine kinase
MSDLETALADERRRNEQLKLALEESENNARKMDELVSMVSHDLRSPLSSIQLNVQSLLHSRKPVPDWVRARLARAEELIRHMTRLINDLLVIERQNHQPSTPATEEIDLHAFVRDAVSLLGEQIEAAKSAVNIHCDEAIYGRWERICLTQIVSNLVTNAIKYGGGKPFEISIGRHEGCARLAVSDHGIGLDEADHERIFERFAQLRPTDSQDGVGLGLWIVAEAAHRLNGRIRIRSSVGQGATFIVDLPCL